MLAKKTIFIIPGYRHVPINKAYLALFDTLKGEGYDPILVNIPWKKTTISENTAYFLAQYRKVTTKKKYILGFSFGAMIAFLAATKVNPSGLILCSLSPYFQEDLPNSPLNCAMLAKKIKAKRIMMLYGSKEAKSLINRVNEAYDQILVTEKSLFKIKAADHNIGDKRYLQTIHQVAKVLN